MYIYTALIYELICFWILSFVCNNMRKKYHIVGTAPKFNRNRGKIDTHNTHE